jgi:hypothetical protein
MPDRTTNQSTVPKVTHKGHELTDVHAGWIFGIVFFLAVSGIMVHLLMREMLFNLNRHPAPTDLWPATPSVSAPSVAATFPRLQISPPRDLAAFRAQEDAELNTYGWINRTAGVARIPIDQAMNLLLQRGLPARQSTNQVKTGNSIYDLMLQRSSQRDARTNRSSNP